MTDENISEGLDASVLADEIAGATGLDRASIPSPENAMQENADGGDVPAHIRAQMNPAPVEETMVESAGDSRLEVEPEVSNEDAKQVDEPVRAEADPFDPFADIRDPSVEEQKPDGLPAIDWEQRFDMGGQEISLRQLRRAVETSGDVLGQLNDSVQQWEQFLAASEEAVPPPVDPKRIMAGETKAIQEQAVRQAMLDQLAGTREIVNKRIDADRAAMQKHQDEMIADAVERTTSELTEYWPEYANEQYARKLDRDVGEYCVKLGYTPEQVQKLGTSSRDYIAYTKAMLYDRMKAANAETKAKASRAVGEAPMQRGGGQTVADIRAQLPKRITVEDIASMVTAG